MPTLLPVVSSWQGEVDTCGDSEAVLDVGATVGEGGADVVGLEQAQSQPAAYGQVDASTGHQGEGAGGAGRACAFGEDGVESMGDSKERFTEERGPQLASA